MRHFVRKCNIFLRIEGHSEKAIERQKCNAEYEAVKSQELVMQD